MTKIEALEQQLSDSRLLLENREMVLKLSENREFRKVILEDFCEKECARYARASGDPALTPEQRADALAMAQAAGHLKRYLSVQVVVGNTAANTIPEIETAIEELRAHPETETEDDE